MSPRCSEVQAVERTLGVSAMGQHLFTFANPWHSPYSCSRSTLRVCECLHFVESHCLSDLEYFQVTAVPSTERQRRKAFGLAVGGNRKQPGLCFLHFSDPAGKANQTHRGAPAAPLFRLHLGRGARLSDSSLADPRRELRQ